MEIITNPKGPPIPPGDVEVPEGDVREPPLPGERRSERFPGKNQGSGDIEQSS
jgi:hypothetical protein